MLYAEPVSGSVPSGATHPLPASLGRYQVLGAIASGGMATVYLARVTGLAGFEREVAIKITHSHLRDEPDFVTALIDEARLAGRIRHQNVVSILDVGVDSAGVFIVMDYVDGDSLSTVLRAMRKQDLVVPIGIALRIIDDTLAGLHAAHQLADAEGNLLGLVHRDVTPHNILLATDGVSRLADFGIAKAASRLGSTSTGLVKGKAAYMSPEQAQGAEVDRRSDVWAAGVVAWELLTGQRLYDGPNDAAILFKIVRERPMRVKHLRKDVPDEIDASLARALEPDPAKRFASAEEFADALAEAAEKHQLKADHREVRRFFEPILAPLIEKRAARMRDAAAGLEARSNPSNPIPASDPRGGLLPPHTPTVRSSPPFDAALAPAANNQPGTGGTSAIDLPPVARSSPRPWVVGAVAGGSVVAAFGLVAFLGSSTDEGSKPATTAATSQLNLLPPITTPSPTSAPEPDPVGAVHDAGADAAPAGDAAPKRVVAPVYSDDKVPLGNPYKKGK